jgi:hypothetical protein
MQDRISGYDVVDRQLGSSCDPERHVRDAEAS